MANTESQKDGIATFTTPQGEIYEFVDKAGNIYLDETQISPEHPHLRSMGINVKNRAEMEEYLKHHTVEGLQQAIAASQLTFAHGVRGPKGIDKYLLSSAIMTQANTFYHLTEELQNNDGSVVKRVILFDNNAYLWSTENGYEFFVEQALTINEENYDKINNLLSTYGTDEFTAAAISSIQRSKDKETGSRSLADFARRERSGENSGPIGQNSRRISEISNAARNNGNPMADTESPKDGIATFTTSQREIYGFADRNCPLQELVW